MAPRDTISLLYDAGIGEGGWDSALQAMSDDLGGAVVLIAGGDARDPTSFDSRTHDFDHGVYAGAGFSHEDGLDPRINPMMAAGYDAPVGAAWDLSARIPVRTLRESAFYETVLLAQDVADARCFALVNAQGRQCGGFVARRGGQLDARGRRTLDRLLPHVVRAMSLDAMARRRRGSVAALGAVLERAGTGFALLSADGRVLVGNEEFETIAAAADGLTTANGRLRLRGADRKALAAHLARLDGAAPADAETLDLLVARPSGRPALALTVFPALGWSGVPGASAACACLFVTDPLAKTQLPPVETVMAALGLTPAEARVARLTPLAMSRREIADALGLSENTVKSHLAAVSGKLGLRNGQIARVVSRLPPG